MPPFQVKTETDINTRRTALQRRLAKQHDVIRKCRDWHNMDEERLKSVIWRGVVENVKRHTVISPGPVAVKDTSVAFTTHRTPKIDATPLNTLSAEQLRAANFNNRAGYAIWHTLNKHRPQTLSVEAAEGGFGDAVMIAKACWLKPEQRGDERVAEPVPLLDALPFADGGMEDEPEELVKYTTVRQGSFPILNQIYDPLDCVWSLGKDGSTLEFIHVSQMTWDAVVDLYPDILEKERFRTRDSVSNMDEVVEVIDYWDATNNAIMVAGSFYKEPTPHQYPYCPVIIEMANVRKMTYGNSTEAQMVATPITWGMLSAAADASWTESIAKTYTDYAVFGLYKHTGIDPDDSPHMVVKEGSQEKEYDFDVPLEPGAVLPMFANKHGSEDFRPIEPANVNPQLIFLQQRSDTNMSLVGLNLSFLSGMSPTPPDSGYGVVQQRIPTTAKMTKVITAIDRFLSRLMTLNKDLIVWEWDYGDPAEVEMVLTDLLGEGTRTQEEPVKISRDAFAAIRSVDVQVVPEVPLNDEAETQKLFQAQSQRAMSRYRLIDKLGYAEDPEEEMERIAAEEIEDLDPEIGPLVKRMRAIKWLKRNGYDTSMLEQMAQPQPPQPQNAPVPLLPGPGGADPTTAAPPPGMDPAMMGAMDPSMLAGMDPSMAGAGPPIDPATLMAMMQGGD